MTNYKDLELQHRRLSAEFKPRYKIAYSSVCGCNREGILLAVKSGVADFGTVLQFNTHNPQSTLIEVEWDKPCPNPTDWIDACRCIVTHGVLHRSPNDALPLRAEWIAALPPLRS